GKFVVLYLSPQFGTRFASNFRPNYSRDLRASVIESAVEMPVPSSIEIAPSILAADFASLGDAIRAVERASVSILHVDVMDGHFVPNISIGVPVVSSLRKATRMTLDVHLMIENPDQ